MGKTNNKELNYHGRVSRDYRLRKVTTVSESKPMTIYQSILCNVVANQYKSNFC